MKNLCSILILLAVGLINISNAKAQNQKTSFKYIGDNNYTKVLRDYVIKDESRLLIAIMFTNKNCQTCDIFEPQLQQIEQSFTKENIALFRCDITANKMIGDRFQIKRFPVVHFVYKRPDSSDDQSPQIQIYKTTQILTSKVIQTAKYLRKILEFLENEKTNKPLIQTLEQIPNMNKIVVNIETIQEFYNFDESDFVSQLMLDESFNSLPIVPLSQQLFQFYSVSSGLENIRQNAKVEILVFIVLEQAQSHAPLTFPIEKKQFDRLISLNLDITSIFKSLLFHSAQQFTQNLYIFQQQFYSLQNPSIPIYLAVIDTIWKRQQAQKQVMMLNKVLNTFGNQILIFWIQAEINPEKKVLLGFNKNTQPPMFGKLVLAKNQLKQPLKDNVKNSPVFTQSDIKARIRTDLGYEKLLPQKINSTIQQLGLGKFIEISNRIQTQKGSTKIQFGYCTQKYIPKNELSDLEFTIRRFKRFYRDSSMKILTQPCFVNDKPVQDGLYMSSNSIHYLVSSTIVPCFKNQPKIQSIAISFSEILHRKKLIPQYFCVPERQMRDFINNLKQ